MGNKSAFIAIIGVPNVGKSSLLNALLGQKISIVSTKPQTTRNRIMGILTQAETQLVFIDTPGVHTPKTQLGHYMEKSIKNSILSVDSCLFVVEAGKNLKASELKLIKKLKNLKFPVILAINKIDVLQDKSVLMKQISQISELINLAAVVPISAKTHDGLDVLLSELKKVATCEGHFFQDDALTDQPERVIVSEIIREKILQLVDKEIPHGVAVCVEKMRDRGDGSLMDIDATIYCEKTTHKGILIGKHGTMLKKIGSLARSDIENFFDTKVNLQVWVKVKEDWRNRAGLLKNFGFDEKNFNM
ncbi:gTPase Era [Clostridium sp. CAG:557]|nr:gTPase Era [Clostridium sp. CAG:557]